MQVDRSIVAVDLLRSRVHAMLWEPDGDDSIVDLNYLGPFASSGTLALECLSDKAVISTGLDGTWNAQRSRKEVNNERIDESMSEQ